MRQSRRASAPTAPARRAPRRPALVQPALESEVALTALDVLVAVGGDDQRQRRPARERRPQTLDRGLVERAGRLVEQQQPRLAQQRASERELLHHPGRAAIDARGGDLAPGRARYELLDLAPGARGRLAQAGEREQVLASGQPQVERALLRERGSDALAGGARSRLCALDT